MLKNILMRMMGLSLLANLVFVALFSLAQTNAALAASAPSLGVATSFAVLGASTVTNTGPTVVIGDLGLYPGTSVTGFPPGIVTGGTIQTYPNPVPKTAQADTTTAYKDLAGQACTTVLTGLDLGGKTLSPRVYCFSSSAQLTGTLTLDAKGDSNAVWVFQISSTLTTASNAVVRVINGGQGCNVFWQVGSSATLGIGTKFIGNILALASITLNTGSSLSGRALAQTGAVTLDGNTVTSCSLSPPATEPGLGKAFDPATIHEKGVSILTITLSNADATDAILTAPLIDTLPSGVFIANPTNARTTCGGGTTATATAGGTTVTLPSGRSIPANSSCTVTVHVTAPIGGNYIDTLATGALQTSNGNNPVPAFATLTVITPLGVPTIGKAFHPATIYAGGVSTLTITLSNADATDAILTAPLIDTLPSGVFIANPTNARTTCGGGTTATATAGGTRVILPSGRSIPANSSCTVTVDVTAPIGDNYIDTLATGALRTSNGNNPAPAVATLTVITPIVPLGKAFDPATIARGRGGNVSGVATLTITLSNADATDASLTAPLTDSLPPGVVIATPLNVNTTCVGGTVTATAGGKIVTLTGGSIPAHSSCAVTAKVTALCTGSYVNTLPIGALQTDHGQNSTAAVATLTVSTNP